MGSFMQKEQSQHFTVAIIYTKSLFVNIFIWYVNVNFFVSIARVAFTKGTLEVVLFSGIFQNIFSWFSKKLWMCSELKDNFWPIQCWRKIFSCSRWIDPPKDFVCVQYLAYAICIISPACKYAHGLIFILFSFFKLRNSFKKRLLGILFILALLLLNDYPKIPFRSKKLRNLFMLTSLGIRRFWWVFCIRNSKFFHKSTRWVEP